MVLTALSRAGGVDYLVRQAENNPGPFLQLVSKCLPKEITHEAGPTLLEALKQAAQRRTTIDVTPRAVDAIEVIDHDRPA